jgi:anti-sigma B factor antagonist
LEQRIAAVIEPAELRLERSGARTVARIFGDIDLSNAAVIKQGINDSVTNEAMDLVLDLTEVRYLDSAGIAMLFGLARSLEGHGQRMVIVVPSSSLIHRSLQVSGWPSTIAIVERLAEALESPSS